MIISPYPIDLYEKVILLPVYGCSAESIMKSVIAKWYGDCAAVDVVPYCGPHMYWFRDHMTTLGMDGYEFRILSRHPVLRWMYAYTTLSNFPRDHEEFLRITKDAEYGYTIPISDLLQRFDYSGVNLTCVDVDRLGHSDICGMRPAIDYVQRIDITQRIVDAIEDRYAADMLLGNYKPFQL